MKRNSLTLFLIFVSFTNSLNAQDISGYWQGVFYQSSSLISNYSPISLTIIQDGSTFKGQAYQFALNQKQYYVYETIIDGKINNSTGSWRSGTIGPSNAPPGVYYCSSSSQFTYYPNEEKILATVSSSCGVGTSEIYRLKLKSPSRFCSNQIVDLMVTGKDVKWYADQDAIKLLHQGNTYKPVISKTTTFYVTQTYYGTETPAIPVTIEINNVSINNIKSTLATCQNNNGSITVDAAGQGGLMYNANGGAFQKLPVFDHLAPKSYTITVQDENGCQAVKETTVAQQTGPSLITVKSKNPSCNQASGEITVEAIGGTGQLNFSIDSLNYQKSNAFVNLKEGNYKVSVKDANNCGVSKEVRLTQQAGPIINNVQVKNAQCDIANGSIIVTASGQSIPLSYSIRDTTYQSSEKFNAVDAGQYTITVKDANGCKANQTIVLTQQSGPLITNIKAGAVTCGASDGKVSVLAQGKNLPLVYSIDQTTFLHDSTFSNLRATNYIITVKDALGCLNIQNVVLTENCRDAIYIPTAFSPNGDGLNEGLAIYFPFSSLTLTEITVFDRWGSVVYYSNKEGPLLSGDKVWSGMNGDILLSTGVYNCSLKVKMPSGMVYSFNRSIQLIR